MKTAVRSGLRRTGLTRSRAASIRALVERAALSAVVRAPRRARPRVLCYHSVGTPEWGVNDVSAARFRRQIEGAMRAGHRFVPARRIAAGEAQPHELAITFDDGLATVATNAAPILAEYGIPWTLFVVSGWADGRGPMPELLMRWPHVERLMAGGAEIGSHSATHSDFSRLPECELERELVASQEAIYARLGVRPTLFAIPNGRRRDWSDRVAALARDAGYEHVFSACEDRRAPGTVGRTMITSWDGERLFRSALRGAFDGWEEWIP